MAKMRTGGRAVSEGSRAGVKFNQGSLSFRSSDLEWVLRVHISCLEPNDEELV